MTWTTALVPEKSGNTYSYPLGTGVSWSKPIELTRVYVVAPLGIDFDIKYPAIGSEQSGYEVFGGPRIDDYYQLPAYAIDEARGDFGRVWRATYAQSNPSDDIVITARPQTVLGKIITNFKGAALILAFAFAIIVGMALWILAWYFLMPRLIGRDRDQTSRLNWYHGLIYPLVNAGMIIFPGVILYGIFALGLAIPSLILLFLLFGG